MLNVGKSGFLAFSRVSLAALIGVVLCAAPALARPRIRSISPKIVSNSIVNGTTVPSSTGALLLVYNTDLSKPPKVVMRELHIGRTKGTTLASAIGTEKTVVGVVLPTLKMGSAYSLAISRAVSTARKKQQKTVTITFNAGPPMPPDSPLTADAGADVSGNKGSSLQFTGSATGGTPPYAYSWSFGDGASALGTVNPEHTFADDGTFTVTFVVTDAAGRTSQDSTTATIVSSGGGGDGPTTLPRLQQGDIQWLGAFLLPSGTYGPSRFGYGGAAPGFYKDTSGRETLYMEGHAWYKGNAAQVQIPTVTSVHDFANLPRAAILQGFADITDGKLGGRSGDGLGSMMAYNGRLLVGSYVYYDADGGQQNFIGASGFTLSSTTDFRGFFPPSGTNPGRLGRYMTTIPTEWQALLGGPAMTGACCLSIISRTNSGPGISVFNPDHVGSNSFVPVREVLGYPLEHPVSFGGQQGACSVQSSVFNCTTDISATAFPSGTRSVLFFGAQGTGPICYKDDGPIGCRGTGGYNAPPYRTQVWAYDANDLVAVRNGQKQSWEISPYAIWQLNFEFNTGGVGYAGGTYDPVRRRLYLIERNGEDPIVHVLQINTL